MKSQRKTSMIEVLKEMVAALEWCHGGEPVGTAEAIQAGKKLIAELESQEPVAWKPIETAPKDGAMLLVCLPRQMNIVVRAWYNKLHNFWQTDYEGEGGITRPIYFHKGDLWHPIPSLYTHPPQRPRVVFPTMLRKMWSGGEVQAWLDENVNKEKNT